MNYRLYSVRLVMVIIICNMPTNDCHSEGISNHRKSLSTIVSWYSKYLFSS